KNCMSAQVVTNKPRYSEARAVLPPRKSEISFGMTGAMMPKASMSSRTVTKMKPSAACRLANMRNLQRGGNRVQGCEPEIDGTVDPLAVMRSAIVQEESAKSSQHDGCEHARMLASVTFADQRLANKLQPVFNRMVQEAAVALRIPHRKRVGLEKKLEQ